MEIKKDEKVLRFLKMGQVDDARDELINILSITHKKEWDLKQESKYFEIFPSYKEMNKDEYYEPLDVWLKKQEYIPMTLLEMEKELTNYFLSKYAQIRESKYPKIENFADAFVKDWDSLPDEFKSIFKNVGLYIKECLDVKKDYPKGL